MPEKEYKYGDADKKHQRNSSAGGGGPRMGRPVEKSRDPKKALNSLFGYIKPVYPIIIALVLGMIASIISVIGPSRLSKITDLIMHGLTGVMNIERISQICAFFFGLYGLSFLVGYLQSFLLITTTQKLSKQLRSDISEKINRLPLKYFDKTSYGDVQSRVTNDVSLIAQSLNQSVSGLVSSVTLIIGTLFMMFITNYILALAALTSSLLGFFVIGKLIKKSQKYFISQQASLGEINGHIEEMYAGHTIVKAYNGEKAAEETFDEINARLYHSARRASFLSRLMMPFMGFIGNLGYVIVCVLGAVLAINKQISFGVIVSFTVYVRLFSNPLSQLAEVFSSLQSTLAASERVFDFLEEKELDDEKHITKKLSNVKGEVEFKHIKFGYEADKLVIKDFSALAKPGQTIAIVGPTGAGKTTIVNLLMRFYEPNSGQILIDGVPIDELTRANVREQFSMVLQDTWIFEGSLRENLVYSKAHVTDKDLDRVCTYVGLSHFVKTLPKGYETLLNEQSSVSQGQKQLITIARAMLQNTPLLILDEATSSVDTKTEKTVQDSMKKLASGRTSFVIAHRLSTIKNADLILVMKNGDIVESGTHDKLLSDGGFYQELYNSQFEPEQ